ncbi:Asp-tRNA(Asn)/Glu-tRNA(Gln) amidotransferase subunit GatA [candidate division NPL-UPA2 bacterium Unc8]|uniref:Glutamyl-tRNA(Gln) amidotransferase subunit A n=1 Tax=candidate division NPL-UPA2 bacterium Unc8 TaxID=1980939 RepID=A0A399FY51_UNCN2|nr:MAG: Asp-tRNA(Asn)/Glu-tRNA(Gln) amidotransferase subunit GatA [candidate division NPL-UPA2 bacterium Unc8]
MELAELAAHEIHCLLKKKEVSVVEVVDAVLTRIDEVDDNIGAFITVNGEGAQREALRIDQEISRGREILPLTGIPVAIKDLICIKGMKTTCASRILNNFYSPYDATVIEKLREAGTIFIGKTNMDEFAMGSSTENSCFGITRNPLNPDTVPGGSSGGSAAAVAAGEAIIALGSDTGGSIRQPAAFCGVVGLVPTYGLVSRFGLVAFASSLDQIGPITRDVRDCALLMNLICGYDPRDSTSAATNIPDYTDSLLNDVREVKIGIPKQYFGEEVDEEVAEAMREAMALFKRHGAKIENVSLPNTEYAIATYYLIATAEASSNLARYDGVGYGQREKSDNILEMYEKTREAGFGDEVKRRIMLGTYVLSAGYYETYYLKAQQARALIRDDFEKAFQKFDCLLAPVSPTTAFKVGEKTDDPLKMYLSDIFTIPVNLAGLPAISIPCGFNSLGSAIGLQLIAKPFNEEMLLRVAYTFEENTKMSR